MKRCFGERWRHTSSVAMLRGRQLTGNSLLLMLVLSCIVFIHRDHRDELLGLRLYLLYLTGHLKPQDEPQTLLSRAIESGMIEIEREYKRKHVARGKHPCKGSVSR